MSTISGFQSSLSGLQQGLNMFRKNAQTISNLGSESTFNSSLTSAIIQTKSAQIQIEASSKSIAIRNETLGSFLDELA